MFRPIRRRIPSTDRPVGKWDGPSANILSRLQTGGLIWEQFVQYADWTKCRQIGQNVGRWDVPSADVPSSDWAKCSQMGLSADGTAHLPTLCSDGRRDGSSGNILSSMQIAQKFRQSGQNVARWDRPNCRRPVCRLDKMSADRAKCWQMGCPIC